MTIFWCCIHCPAHGTTSGTESGADVKHGKAEQHCTFTSVRECAGAVE